MNFIARWAGAAAIALMTAVSAFAADPHKVAIQIDQNDPDLMNLVLNNAQNVKSYYKEKGEDVSVEIVAYGPGLKMYTPDSPVKERIAAMSLENPDMQFSACGNTLKKMSEKAGKEVKLISEAVVVPAGVVRLMELQEQGWSYVRP